MDTSNPMPATALPTPAHLRGFSPVGAFRLLLRAVAALFLVVGATGCGFVGGDDGAASGPEQPTFTFVIPAGSAEKIEAGEALDILPRELRTEIGETIQIINEDDSAHVLGPWFLAAGETLRQRFVTPGVFDGSCSVHPSGAFTVVVEPTEEA